MNDGWYTVNTKPPQGQIVWLYCKVLGTNIIFQTSGYYRDTIWCDWCGDILDDDNVYVKYWRKLPPDPDPKTKSALDKLESKMLSEEDSIKISETINSEMRKIIKELEVLCFRFFFCFILLNYYVNVSYIIS